MDLIGKELKVRIINIDEENRKLILSEKEAQNEVRLQALKKIAVGEIVDGKISGVVNFGIFVTFVGLEGLVHISEIAWGHVDDPAKFGRLGDSVKVKVIGSDGEKISLSIKQLTTDPWVDIAKNFKIGQMVTGKINRITEYGAFVTLMNDINGLIHVSELVDQGPKLNGQTNFKVDDEVTAKIFNVDSENHRIGLTVLEGKMPEAHKRRGQQAESFDDSTAIEDLSISEKAVKSLKAKNINTVADIKKLTEDELLNIEGVGPATVAKIMQKI